MASLGGVLHLLLPLHQRLLETVQRQLEMLVAVAGEDHAEPARLRREERLALRITVSLSIAYRADDHLAVLVDEVVQLLLGLEGVADHVLRQIDPAEIAGRAVDHRDVVLLEEVLRDHAALPDALAQRVDVVLDVLLVVQHVRDHRLAHRGHLAEMRQLGEAPLHALVPRPQQRHAEARQTEVLRHAPQHRHVVRLGVVLDQLRVAHVAVVRLRAQRLRLHRQRVDLVREQVQVVLAGPVQHHSQLRLRVDVPSRVRRVRHHQHLHRVALRLRLLARVLQNLLRDLVVVRGDIRHVHHAAVAERHVASELHVAGGDHDVRVALVEHGRAEHIHGGARASEHRDLIVGNGGLEHFLRHEIGQSLAHVLATRTADGVHVIRVVQSAELLVLGLELVPQINVLGTRNVHHTLRVLGAPRVLRILGSIAHVRGEGGNGHQSLSSMHQDGRSTAYKSEYSIF